MASDYVVLAVFLGFSMLAPFSMIITSKILGNRIRSNPVSRGSYESAEYGQVERVSIMNEYIHYFSIFIAFEVVAVIVLLWVVAARVVSASSSLAVLSMLISSMLFGFFVLLLAKKEE